MAWLSPFNSGDKPRKQPKKQPDQPQQPPPQPPPPPPPTPAPGWVKGQRRTTLEVICCPSCGSRYARIRTPRGDTIALWECRECGDQWKDDRTANRLG